MLFACRRSDNALSQLCLPGEVGRILLGFAGRETRRALSLYPQGLCSAGAADLEVQSWQLLVNRDEHGLSDHKNRLRGCKKVCLDIPASSPSTIFVLSGAIPAPAGKLI
jgi:hypothetical protein